MDRRDELRDLTLAANELVIRLSGVLRFDARNPHGALYCIDQFWRELVDDGEDAVLKGGISRHLRFPLVPA